MKKRTTIKIGKSDLEVIYWHQPYERQTFDSPEIREFKEVCEVTYNGKEVKSHKAHEIIEMKINNFEI